MSELERMREVKQLMAGIDGRLANDDVFSMRRTMDDVVLAMNLLVGLVEGHRHSYDAGARNRYDGGTVEYPVTGPMQALQDTLTPREASRALTRLSEELGLYDGEDET